MEEGQRRDGGGREGRGGSAECQQVRSPGAPLGALWPGSSPAGDKGLASGKIAVAAQLRGEHSAQAGRVRRAGSTRDGTERGRHWRATLDSPSATCEVRATRRGRPDSLEQHDGSRFWVGCTKVRGGGPKTRGGATGPGPLDFSLSSE